MSRAEELSDLLGQRSIGSALIGSRSAEPQQTPKSLLPTRSFDQSSSEKSGGSSIKIQFSRTNSISDPKTQSTNDGGTEIKIERELSSASSTRSRSENPLYERIDMLRKLKKKNHLIFISWSKIIFFFIKVEPSNEKKKVLDAIKRCIDADSKVRSTFDSLFYLNLWFKKVHKPQKVL